MSKDKNSVDALSEATRSRAAFSGHNSALGAAGYREISLNPDNSDYLREPGQSISISPGAEEFDSIMIGVEWDNVAAQKSGLFSKLLERVTNKGVDLDLGCLYELEDGTRGAIQAFGNKYGDYNNAPYIQLCGDERTGNKAGMDETMVVNAAHWTSIKRMLIYIYIYEGAPHWKEINPQLLIDVPGEDDLVVTLGVHDDSLPLCAVGGLEQVRGGIRLTNYTEYFPGHLEMDRAFGYGLEWADGRKG